MITDTMPIAGTDAPNPITANLYDAPAYFSGDTPLAAINRAFQAFSQNLQQRGTSREEMAAQAARDCPEGFETVILRGKPVLRCKGRGMATEGQEGETPGTITGPVPDLRDLYPGIPLPPRGGVQGIPEGAPGGPPSPKGSSCSPFDLECLFTSDTAKDIGKRAVLLIFALVILVVAIVSLR